jgi:hypothetical protein
MNLRRMVFGSIAVVMVIGSATVLYFEWRAARAYEELAASRLSAAIDESRELEREFRVLQEVRAGFEAESRRFDAAAAAAVKADVAGRGERQVSQQASGQPPKSLAEIVDAAALNSPMPSDAAGLVREMGRRRQSPELADAIAKDLEYRKSQFTDQEERVIRRLKESRVRIEALRKESDRLSTAAAQRQSPWTTGVAIGAFSCLSTGILVLLLIYARPLARGLLGKAGGV